MNRLINTLIGITVATLYHFPVLAEDKEPSSPHEMQQRELIYCADFMTHEERETYRKRMRTVGTPQEQDVIRQAHREKMQARLRERDTDPIECEPYRHRQRYRGGTP